MIERLNPNECVWDASPGRHKQLELENYYCYSQESICFSPFLTFPCSSFIFCIHLHREKTVLPTAPTRAQSLWLMRDVYVTSETPLLNRPTVFDHRTLPFGVTTALTISMMRWPQTKHFSAVCWKPEYCGWDQTRDQEQQPTQQTTNEQREKTTTTYTNNNNVAVTWKWFGFGWWCFAASHKETSEIHRFVCLF